jgi:hypothetical protein
LPWGPSWARRAVATATNHDGNVNDANDAILAAHWGEGGGEESVPEPGSLALLAGMAVMWVVYLRRRKAQRLRGVATSPRSTVAIEHQTGHEPPWACGLLAFLLRRGFCTRQAALSPRQEFVGFFARRP